MREIKFRAWDKKDKEIITPKVLCNLDGIMQQDDGRTVLMQYTGLQDKKGVEIYEGDVGELNGLRYQCCYSYRHAWFYWNQLGDINTPYSGGISGHDMRKVEVIGNIYENSELLEKK